MMTETAEISHGTNHGPNVVPSLELLSAQSSSSAEGAVTVTCHARPNDPLGANRLSSERENEVFAPSTDSESEYGAAAAGGQQEKSAPADVVENAVSQPIQVSCASLTSAEPPAMSSATFGTSNVPSNLPSQNADVDITKTLVSGEMFSTQNSSLTASPIRGK